MSNVKIKKAKIKDDIFLEVEYTEELPGHGKKDMKLTCTVPVHQDLKIHLKNLISIWPYCVKKLICLPK
ncbi:MAG: hypothetical protein IPJ81_18230 [Chitinophagaceae bacterium]|nr:hypothetical protein [Chitinophagaceae bacterium]